MVRSDAFNEFIYKRCDEIVSNDDESIASNESVLELEEKFKAMLSQEQLKTFAQLEEKVIKSLTYDKYIIYKSALNDKNELF